MSDGFLDDKIGGDSGETKETEPVDVPEETPDDVIDVPAADDSNSIVKPVDNIDEVVDVYETYEDLKENLLDRDTDMTTIGNSFFINKSGWRKIATAFNVSVETVEDARILEEGVVKYKVKARATAPNGKTASGLGMCASNESNHMDVVDSDAKGRNLSEEEKNDPDVMLIDGKWRRLKDPREVNDHNIFATAATRAKNRAISDLVGGGEVSAEEITKEDVL